jgi:DNA-binding MarR family transcriptional regulator
MSDSGIDSFGKRAKSLSGSPLGIIALFIVLIYGFAALTLGIAAKNLTASLQIPLVWFLVLFPILVLIVFAWLVTRHHHKLYGPSDFTDQALFIELQKLREFKAEAQPVIDRQIENSETPTPVTLSLAPHKIEGTEETLLRILAEGKYTFRTLRGLASEANLPRAEVEKLVTTLESKNLVSEKMLKNGLRYYINEDGRHALAANAKS